MSSSSSKRFYYYSFVKRVVSTVNVAVTIQIGLTGLSIGRGCGLFTFFEPDGKDEKKNLLGSSREVFDAYHYKLVRNYVSDLYSSSSTPLELKQQQQSQRQQGVKLSESATWENPKCIYKGETEIQQAFRSLVVAEQDVLAMSPPPCVNVQPRGKSILLTYDLEYANNYNQQSLLVVEVEMQQMKSSPEFNEFVITRLQEQWNGIPLFQSLLFYIVKRINGIIAFHFSQALGW